MYTHAFFSCIKHFTLLTVLSTTKLLIPIFAWFIIFLLKKHLYLLRFYLIDFVNIQAKATQKLHFETTNQEVLIT